MNDEKGNPIVMIEYHRNGNLWMPHEVFVSHAPKYPKCCSHYDFNWSRGSETLYFHKAGSGPGVYVNGWPNSKKRMAKLWFDDSAGVPIRQGSGAPVEDFAALGFELIARPLPLGPGNDGNPFDFGVEARVVYCRKCRDHFSEDAHCDHIFWCDRCNEWGGGASDKESCKHRKP
jgi:hypothetical protein